MPTLNELLAMIVEDYDGDPVADEAATLLRSREAHAIGKAQAERIHAAGLAVAEHNRTHPRRQHRSHRRGLPQDTIR